MIVNKVTFDGNDFQYLPGIGISIDNQNEISSDIANMLIVQHTLSDGYYDDNGVIQEASYIDSEKYTNKIPVIEGEQIRVRYSSDELPEGAEMWLAYATFGANQQFIERIEVLPRTVRNGFDETITIGANVSYISLMFNSFARYGNFTFAPLVMINSVFDTITNLSARIDQIAQNTSLEVENLTVQNVTGFTKGSVATARLYRFGRLRVLNCNIQGAITTARQFLNIVPIQAKDAPESSTNMNYIAQTGTQMISNVANAGLSIYANATITDSSTFVCRQQFVWLARS